VIRSFTFPLRPLRAHRDAMHRYRRQACELYNAALEQRVTWWRLDKRSVSYNDQTKGLTELREEPTFADVPVEVQRSALRRVDRAFKAFFRRCKTGQTPGFPRFRSHKRYDSFGVGRVNVRWSADGRGDAYVRVPKVGWVRFRQHREVAGNVRDVELRWDGLKGRWFVRIVCDMGEAPPKRAVRRTTGIDLGLKEFAVLSDGAKVENPRHLRRASEGLARAQRVLAKKQRGSRSRDRARKAVGRAYRRVKNRRTDFHRKLAVSLCDSFDLIAHEDLNIKGLARSALAKSVADVGWGSFLLHLASKAEEAGVHLVAVDPRHTTQLCSECGTLVPKGLSERMHRCTCGCVLDRDHNAALNVLARGLRAVPPSVAAEALF